MEKVFKLMAILTMGLVMALAGCVSSPSEDNPVAGVLGGENEGISGAGSDVVGSWYATVDINNAPEDIIDFQPASMLSYGVTVNGQAVEILNGPGGCSWDGGANELTCDIIINNLSASDSMWDVRSVLHDSEITDPIMLMADYNDGASQPDSPIPINSAGYCYNEAGFNGVSLEGCEEMPDRNGQSQPYQMIHPVCGSHNGIWVFSNVFVGKYGFWVDVEATHITERARDPRRDGSVGGFAIDGDQDHLTYLINVNELDDLDGVDAGYFGGHLGFDLGSTRWIGANGLAVGKSTTVENPVFSPGKYFAAEVLMEFADRMEEYGDIGVLGGGESYEYYSTVAMSLQWDPNVIRMVTSGTMTTPGGTELNGNVVHYHCSDYWRVVKVGGVNKSNCAAGWQGHQPFASASMATNVSNLADGFVSTSYIVNDFSTLSSPYYYFPAAGVGTNHYDYVSVSGNAPNWRGQKGQVTFDTSTGVMSQDGVDPLPDWSAGLIYMEVIGASGSGTELISSNNSFTVSTVKWTDGDISNGSMAGRPHTLPNMSTPAGGGLGICNGTACLIEGGNARGNPLLPGGYGIAFPGALGGYQQVSAHVCVQ